VLQEIVKFMYVAMLKTDFRARAAWRPGQVANEAILVADVSQAGEMVDSLMRLQRRYFLHGDVRVDPDQSRPIYRHHKLATLTCSNMFKMKFSQFILLVMTANAWSDNN